MVAAHLNYVVWLLFAETVRIFCPHELIGQKDFQALLLLLLFLRRPARTFATLLACDLEIADLPPRVISSTPVPAGGCGAIYWREIPPSTAPGLAAEGLQPTPSRRRTKRPRGMPKRSCSRLEVTHIKVRANSVVDLLEKQSQRFRAIRPQWLLPMARHSRLRQADRLRLTDVSRFPNFPPPNFSCRTVQYKSRPTKFLPESQRLLYTNVFVVQGPVP